MQRLDRLLVGSGGSCHNERRSRRIVPRPGPPAPPPLHLAQHLAAGQASILIIIIIILRPDISTFAFANYEVISGIKIITKGDHTREHEETY